MILHMICFINQVWITHHYITIFRDGRHAKVVNWNNIWWLLSFNGGREIYGLTCHFSYQKLTLVYTADAIKMRKIKQTKRLILLWALNFANINFFLGTDRIKLHAIKITNCHQVVTNCYFEHFCNNIFICNGSLLIEFHVFIW